MAPYIDPAVVADYATPDPEVAESIYYNSYPGIQCRLDNFLAASIESERPSCWYVK